MNKSKKITLWITGEWVGVALIITLYTSLMLAQEDFQSIWSQGWNTISDKKRAVMIAGFVVTGFGYILLMCWPKFLMCAEGCYCTVYFAICTSVLHILYHFIRWPLFIGLVNRAINVHDETLFVLSVWMDVIWVPVAAFIICVLSKLFKWRWR